MKKVCTVFIFSLLSFFAMAQKPASAPTGKTDPSMPIYLVDGVETPYAKVVKIKGYGQCRVILVRFEADVPSMS